MMDPPPEDTHECHMNDPDEYNFIVAGLIPRLLKLLAGLR